MTALDPKFPKIVALMRSTTHPGEQEAARGRAEAMAAAAGMSLDEAMAIGMAPQAATGIFAGFDDYMEEREPGWKAARTAERLAKHRAWSARREALVEKYGSIAAAIEPCERERLILAAVASWRTVQDNPRWTRALDGWRGDTYSVRKEAPRHILAAIEQAYPLPTTFADAKAEHDYWEARDRELDDAFSEDGAPIGDEMLDLPAAIRAEIVRDLAEHEIAVTTITDLHARFAMYRAREFEIKKVADALFRDVEAMANRERNPPTPSPVHDHGQVAAMLKQHPSWPDRRIARAAGCSPTTVGKVRRAIGANAATRSVQRRGQVYDIKVTAAEEKRDVA